MESTKNSDPSHTQNDSNMIWKDYNHCSKSHKHRRVPDPDITISPIRFFEHSAVWEIICKRNPTHTKLSSPCAQMAHPRTTTPSTPTWQSIAMTQLMLQWYPTLIFAHPKILSKVPLKITSCVSSLPWARWKFAIPVGMTRRTSALHCLPCRTAKRPRCRSYTPCFRSTLKQQKAVPGGP